MKKVMVYAVSKLNLGDDLFLEILFKRYPDTKFILTMPSKFKSKYKYNNVKIYSSSSIIFKGINYIMNKFNINSYSNRFIARSCDASVYIGGSIFQQRENWRGQIKRRKNLVLKNQPFYVLGANFGPYDKEDYFNLYKESFLEYKDICFRDDYSYNLFNDLNNVRKADDIVFSLKGNQIDEKSNDNDNKSLVISVIKPSHRPYLDTYDEEYYRKLKEVSIGYINKGYTITLISFCAEEGDEEGINALMKIIPEEHKAHIKIHKYRGDLEAALEVINSSSSLIATRFHAMILGWLYNKPTLPIAYSEKMTNVMRDVGYRGIYIDFSNLEDLEFDRVYEDFKSNSVDISKQKVNAENHFQELDKLLLKSNL